MFHRTYLRSKSTLIALVILIVLTLGMGTSAMAQEDEVQAEILWDTWGVPHIYAEDNASLFHAFGWAQMHSHTDLILQLYAQARGRMAEVFGEEALESDVFMHTLGLPTYAQQWYEAQPDEFRSYLDAFADGMNAYAEANPDQIGDHVKAVLPVSGYDPVALMLRNQQMIFVSGQAFSDIPAWQGGSNAWAIAPERSASGNAMMVANPHLDWSDLFVWYEAQLVSPDTSIYGATLVGLPVIAIGFNDNLGWTHTVNTYDGYDLYELALTEAGGYMLDGEEQELETIETTLNFLQEDGTFGEYPLTIARSIHGPLVADREDGTALAIRIAGLDQPGVLSQWWDMGHAANLEEFETALSQLQLSMFTVMYADRDGNIMHLFNGQIPVRSEGDWDFWTGIIPGDRSDLIWTEYHPYEDLPKVINPDSGWLQNANEPPWTTTYPLAIDHTDYPAYFAPEPFMDFRPQISAQMLANDDSITFDELVTYKHSTHMELAARIADDLIAAARESESDIANAAADVLEAWDLNAEADSAGAVLFAQWFWVYVDQVTGSADAVFAIPYDFTAEPFTTPDGLDEPEDAVAMLETVAEQIEDTYGDLAVTWGDVYRLRGGEYDFPANGGDDSLGIFRSTWTNDGPDENNQYTIQGGDSWVFIAEFGDTVTAKVLVSYGNATQPGSPHIGDQLELFAEKELRDAWLTRESVEANLEMQETIE
jgi:acyl-homoserine-lactone acylase